MRPSHFRQRTRHWVRSACEPRRHSLLYVSTIVFWLVTRSKTRLTREGHRRTKEGGMSEVKDEHKERVRARGLLKSRRLVVSARRHWPGTRAFGAPLGFDWWTEGKPCLRLVRVSRPRVAHAPGQEIEAQNCSESCIAVAVARTGHRPQRRCRIVVRRSSSQPHLLPSS